MYPFTHKGAIMHWTTNVSPLIKDIELKHSPVMIRVNEFTEDSAAEFAQKVGLAHNTGQKIIPVIIDSYGGQVYSLMSMIAAIKASEIPVATIVEGKAMSCGAILASFGSEGLRFMDKDSTMMIHDVSSYAFGKIEELKSDRIVEVTTLRRTNPEVVAEQIQNAFGFEYVE